MSMRALQILSLCAGIVLLGGCYYDVEEELYPHSYCETTGVTWSGTIHPLVQSRCLGCHSPGGQIPDLSSYEKFKVKVDEGRIQARVIQGSPSYMPNDQGGGKLPVCQIRQMQAWIDAGALNN